MKRRDAILRATAIMGGTLSTPLLSALLGSCARNTPENISKAKSLIEKDYAKMISIISEIIIPTTNTPGAIAAGVPQFITVIVSECYEKDNQEKFYAGLETLNNVATKKYSKSFIDCPAADQTSLLEKAEKEAFEKREWAFIRMIKELVVVGYFSSEIGATQALEYLYIPGTYKDIDLKPGQKAWAT